VPLLRKHELLTGRPAVQAEGRDGTVIEIFEWASEETSRSAPAISEIGALWKAMSEAMDFVALGSLAESQRPFAHFFPF
jgi:hypothetical protein